jgi:hypothetical protein
MQGIALQVWVDGKVNNMLDRSTAALVDEKRRFHASLQEQARADKEWAWHNLTKESLKSEERVTAEREFVSSENRLQRHDVEHRMCVPHAPCCSARLLRDNPDYSMGHTLAHRH